MVSCSSKIFYIASRDLSSIEDASRLPEGVLAIAALRVTRIEQVVNKSKYESGKNARFSDLIPLP
jgi:hypothetical protein